MTYPTGYMTAIHQLTGRCFKQRKLDNNTYLVRMSPESETSPIGLKLHATYIVMWRHDGTVVVNSGGYRTVTTADRLRKSLNSHSHYEPWAATMYAQNRWTFITDRGGWYMQYRSEEGIETQPRFADSMILHPGGAFERPASAITIDEEQNLVEQIKAYAIGYVQALRRGDIGAPGPGDCLICQLSPGRSHSHLESHIEENYFVPRLVWNAMEMFGASIAAKASVAAWQKLPGATHEFGGLGFLGDQIATVIARLFYRELGLTDRTGRIRVPE